MAELLVYYENYKGGINNLQVAKIVHWGQSIKGQGTKIFTSTIGKAEKYARRWAKKNFIALD